MLVVDPEPRSNQTMAIGRRLFGGVFAVAALLLFFFSQRCSAGHSSTRKPLNSSNATLVGNAGWSPGGATWYGSRTGFGNDAGACGYGNDVGRPPYSSMTASGGASFFESGKGCGSCYQVKCTSHPACSGDPVTVVITDQCLGGPFPAYTPYFDLSGTAFGAMARPGQADELRNAGLVAVQFMRAWCNFSGWKMVFRIGAGSNPSFLEVLIEFVNGDGNLSAVELFQAGSSWGLPMQRIFGAVWKVNPGPELRAPFSFRLTSSSGRSAFARNVIPAGWRPEETFWSSVNF